MAEPRVLLINDIHVSPDNLLEFDLNWNEALDICIRNGIRDIVIGGDLWQSRAAQKLPTLLAVRSAFIRAGEKGINITLAAGNHDLVDKEAEGSYNHIYSEYGNVYVVDDCDFIGVSESVVLYVMRYYPENGSFMEHFQNLLTVKKGFAPDKAAVDILYIHEGIRGGLRQPKGDELPADIFGDFDMVLVGHYHDRNHIPGTNVYYIGASRQHNFGEDEEKGYTLVYDDGTTEFIKNQANMRYSTIELKAPEVKDFNLLKDPKYKYKVKVTCDEKEAKTFDKQKLMELGFDKVEMVAKEIVAKEAVAASINEKYDKDGIVREYVSYCEEVSFDPQLGIKYLEDGSHVEGREN